MMQISSDASLFDLWCEADQASKAPGAPARSVNHTIRSQRAAGVQTSYESMRDALLSCRQKEPIKLRLQDCPTARDQGDARWQDKPYQGLLRWAEGSYTCG